MEVLGWIVAFVFLGVSVAVFARFSAHLARLEQFVHELASGNRSGPRPFFKSIRFARLAEQLEKIGTSREELRRQIDLERWNQEALLASMVEGVMVVDESHLIRLVNQSFLALFGLNVSPLRSSVLSALREASIEKIVTAALATGDPQASEVSIPSRKPGAPFRDVAISAVPLRNNADIKAGVVVVFHDITRIRRLEEIRREFVANVSHELRTPLAIFHGYLENLIDEPAMPRDEIAAVLVVMKRHSLRLNALLEDLLTLARLESRAEIIEFAPIDLPEFLAQVVRDWRPKFLEKKLTVEIQTSPGLPPARADAFRLEQVLSNLLENAIKFTPTDGRITLSAEATDEEIILRVRDSGIGIPPADLPHIFERFYRVEKARSRETGGTGLGLSIVKHIVSLHHGSVSAESAPGSGTTITARLPRS